MSIRLLLLVSVLILVSTQVQSFSGDGYRMKREDADIVNGTDLQLTVGKEVMLPEIEEESDEKQEDEASKVAITDVKPVNERVETDAQDKQRHGRKGKMIEEGMPPKYPLKAESAETSAHDNEIGGCRDHPRAGLVCNKCETGNKCFPAEHESYTYSYCRRSCRHCDPSTSSFHTFWRLRALNEFEPTWMLQQVEFYADPQEKISLVDNPEKAYASSVYTGYKPAYAFDDNNNTAWYPSGWGNHDNNDDWIAYEFTVAVRVHGIRMVVDKEHATAQPKKVVVEASDKMYGPFMKKWTIYNPDYEVDKIYKLLECDVLWRRLEVDDGAWCFRLIAKLETWEGARRTCEIEGGDIATISNKEEQRFVTDEVGICSHTWFGLSHTNQGYFWNDGSNSTYRNWKEELTYSDVQKQTLNCAAIDPEGNWYNFHCSNKFYFICKKRLVPRPDPRPDLTDNAWPYPPEVPPLIFFSPNVTVPVINSKNLEPGVFPDANGKVEGEEEEDITLSDLFYEQTVEHLKEKGLKPSEEIEADANEEETDFTQELNKIAINTSPGDYQNETKGDRNTNKTKAATDEELVMEHIPNKEANNAETANASADSPKPKPQHKNKPIPPPPESSDLSHEDNSYPEIKHGKAVDEARHKKKERKKKLPKGIGSKEKQSFSPDEQSTADSTNPDNHEQPEKAGNIGNVNTDLNNPEPAQINTPAAGQHNMTQQQSMLFYVPNTNGTYTLMRSIYNYGQTPGDAGNTGEPGSSAQTQQAPNPPNVPPPPKPKEGDDSDDDDEDSIEEPPDVKRKQSAKQKGHKNKEIPMSPFTGPLGPSLTQRNISKNTRRKIKVLQPLESAAQGEDISSIGESNKMRKKTVLSRTVIHHKGELKAMSKKGNREDHLVNGFFKEKAKSKVTLKSAKYNDMMSSKKETVTVKKNVTGASSESGEGDESGSGSGSHVEANNADIFPDADEEFWSRK